GGARRWTLVQVQTEGTDRAAQERREQEQRPDAPPSASGGKRHDRLRHLRLCRIEARRDERRLRVVRLGQECLFSFRHVIIQKLTGVWPAHTTPADEPMF